MKRTYFGSSFGGVLLWLLLSSGALTLAACSDNDNEPTALPAPAADAYRADVVQSWLTVQLRLVRTTPVAPAIGFGRPYGYSGIAAYEAIVPGMAGYRSLGGQLNGLSGLPTTDAHLAYCWPLSANAALAALNRGLFVNASAANLATIDSLEITNQMVIASLNADTEARSVAFGKQVAAAVLAWARTDGFDQATPYTLPVGPGLWVPTPPANAPAAFPHWGDNRLLVVGSDEGADPGPPPAYSTDPASPFYAMARDVWTASQSLTAEQRATAIFWNDQPTGRNYPPPGHWLSILSQVMTTQNPNLDQAALAYAKVGIALNEALTAVFKTKYTYNLLRPVTYVRATLGQPAWSPLIITPNFPEYSAAHAVTSAAVAEMLTSLYGANYTFIDQSYVPFGLGPRTFSSFEQAANEAAISRFYGGIHYRPSCEKGLVQGKTIAQNINARLRFR